MTHEEVCQMRVSGKQIALSVSAAAFLCVARPVQAQVLVQAIGGITKTAETKPIDLCLQSTIENCHLGVRVLTKPPG